MSVHPLFYFSVPLSISLPICLSVPPSVHSLFQFVLPSICWYVRLSLLVHLSICVFWLSICMSIPLTVRQLSICWSVGPSVLSYCCLSVHPSLYLSVCPSVCSSVCPSILLSVCPFIPRSIHPLVCLSVGPSIHPSIHLSIHQSMGWSVHQSACLSIRPSVCLSVCLSGSLSVCPVVYKKQKFGHRGGGIYSYFDFLGKIDSRFPLNKSKNKDFTI